LKGFTHFHGDKDEFIRIQNEFQSKEVKLNIVEFSKARKKINKLIKEKISELQLQLIEEPLETKTNIKE
jgi:hypothetical protein